MELKKNVDRALKDQNRSLSWLAGEMNKTFDGLKLSLVKGSLKYTDIIRMADVLKLPAAYFFTAEGLADNTLEEEKVVYSAQRNELSACRELAATLKSQLADKEKIIELLTKNR